MGNKPNWRERIKEVKKIIDRLVRPKQKQLQPALQPIRRQQKF
jgi:hypothetical protein